MNDHLVLSSVEVTSNTNFEVCFLRRCNFHFSRAKKICIICFFLNNSGQFIQIKLRKTEIFSPKSLFRVGLLLSSCYILRSPTQSKVCFGILNWAGLLFSCIHELNFLCDAHRRLSFVFITTPHQKCNSPPCRHCYCNAVYVFRVYNILIGLFERRWKLFKQHQSEIRQVGFENISIYFWL